MATPIKFNKKSARATAKTATTDNSVYFTTDSHGIYVNGDSYSSEGHIYDFDKDSLAEGSQQTAYISDTRAITVATNTASGARSHAEGIGSTASATSAHTEGQKCTASGAYSTAIGQKTTASASGAHAEGNNTVAKSSYAHAEGNGTTASGNQSHAEGIGTIASGKQSHAEGTSTIASMIGAHAEGCNTRASGNYSHAEGNNTNASGINSHTEGNSTNASNINSHAEGLNSIAIGKHSHAENQSTTASGNSSHAEGYHTVASGDDAHAEGCKTTAVGNYSHAEGIGGWAAQGAHVEGIGVKFACSTEPLTIYYNDADGSVTSATIDPRAAFVDDDGTNYDAANNRFWIYDNSECGEDIPNKMMICPDGNPLSTSSIIYDNGYSIYFINNGDSWIGNADPSLGTYVHLVEIDNDVPDLSYDSSVIYSHAASGEGSHAEGYNTTASGSYSHAEGYYTTASGLCSHAEGDSTTASGKYSHAEGLSTASGSYSHAEGLSTAFGSYSHAEGIFTTASGNYSHAEGNGTQAIGVGSHAGGLGTVAASAYQTAIGKYNVQDTSNTYAMIIGGGTSTSARKNIFTVDWTGNTTVGTGAGFYETSDARKKNVKSELDIDRCYEFMNKCSSIVFDWKDDPEHQNQIGMIAQEVQEFFPEVVNTDDKGYLSLDYAKLTVICLRILKDLSDKINKKL